MHVVVCQLSSIHSKWAKKKDHYQLTDPWLIPIPISPFQDWDQPEYIPDPDAEKPEDWDDDMDGEWEPPMIPNPEYKGQYRGVIIV